MARCRCTDTGCACQLNVGTGLVKTGTGVPGDPWVLDTQMISNFLAFVDNTEFDWTVVGTGRPGDPLIISLQSQCISCVGGNVGDVLTKQVDGTYLPGPPAVVPAGSVFSDGVTIEGDGTVATPFSLAPIPTYGALKALAT